MKKRYWLIFACLLSVTSISIKGQDSLKPFAKNMATELNFNPFNGNMSLNNASGQFKLRKFYSRSQALRIAVTVNYMKDDNKLDHNGTSGDITLERSTYSTNFTIGTEKHFKGSNRLSPYIGWELGVGYKQSKQYQKEGSEDQTIKGAWVNYETFYSGYNWYRKSTFSEVGYLSFGISLVTGFDFYIAKGFYLGYEIAFGVDYTDYNDVSFDPAEDPITGFDYPDYDNSSVRIGPKLVNGVRIGYVF